MSYDFRCLKPLNTDTLDFKSSNGLLSQMKLSMALNQRKIFLCDSIYEDSIFECIYYLYRLIDVDNKYDCNEKRPIEILINSNGGSIYDCLTLISLIEKMKDDGYEIITINIGRAFSAGFLLSIVGSRRFAYRYATYMTHDISTFISGKLQEIKDSVEETDRLKNIVYEIIIKYTNLTISQLESWNERKLDKYFSTEESLKFKIVDDLL